MNILMPKAGCEINDPLANNIVTLSTQNCGYVCNPTYFNELMNCLEGGGTKPASTPITNIVNCVKGDLSGSLLNSNDDCVPDDTMPPEGWCVRTPAFIALVLLPPYQLSSEVFKSLIIFSHRTAWKDFICTGDGYKVFGGDHLESASPADPSFWVIHPALERMLQVN